MPRILIVAATTGYQTRLFADAARRLGMDVALATDCCHVLEDPWGDRAIPVRFDDPYSAVEAIAQAGPFDGILAVADRQAFFAAIMAEKLGLTYNSPAAVEAARNKFLMRQRFLTAGMPVPRFFRLETKEDPGEAAGNTPYPCVLKPLGLSASRGVIRADDPAGFVAAFHRIKALLARPEIQVLREGHSQYIQVESFLSGQEYALEGVLTAGRLKTLAVFEKPDPLNGPFFEETIYLTPPRAPQPALVPAIEKAICAMGLTHGPIHAELRVDGSEASVLEVAARPIGGLCAKTLRFDGGMPLEELLLRHAVGEDLSQLEREECASGVMMIPIGREGVYEGVEGLDSALEIGGVGEIEITAKAGQTLEPLPEGASYLGFIFARGKTPEDVERSLRSAHATLRFQIAAKLPVIRR
ncbi:MAG: ATP-grasp domain-containing protein [Bryobacteraceae bacterium]